MSAMNLIVLKILGDPSKEGGCRPHRLGEGAFVGHMQDQVWSCPAVGVITLLREVCLCAIFSGWSSYLSLPA